MTHVFHFIIVMRAVSHYLVFLIYFSKSVNETKSAAFKFCRFSISEESVFPDYLEVTTAVVVPYGFCRTSPLISIQCDIFNGLNLSSFVCAKSEDSFWFPI